MTANETADSLFAGGATFEAIIDLKNVLRSTPHNGRARKLLGLALAATYDFEAAEKELRRALELGEPLNEFRVVLAEA